MNVARRRWLGVPLIGWLVVGALLLGACAPTAPTPDPEAPPGVEPADPAAPADPTAPTRLTVAYPTDLEGWSPYSHSTSTLYARYMHIMEPLVIWDVEENDNAPLLAESWTNPDEHTWEFTLRQGVQFHDGSEFTAEDVIHSFERILNDEDSRQTSALAHIESMEAPDPHTVRIRTERPDAAFLFRLNNRVIVSKSYEDEVGREQADRNPVGTGPYLFKEWVTGQRFVVERNPDYWGPNQATFDEVVFRVISEPEATVTALLNREVDIIGYVPPQLVSRIEGSDLARVEGARGQRLMFLAMNPVFEPWDNKTLRQAVAHAIDKEAIVEGVLGGRAYVLEMPIGEGMYSFDPNYTNPYPYDPDRAMELLAEAGYPDGLQVEMQCSHGRYLNDREICEAFVQMLSQVGIQADLTTPEWGRFWPDVQEGRVPFYMLGRGSVVDPSEYLHQYFRTDVTPRIGFSDPEVDRLLDIEAREFDTEQRIALLHDAMDTIVDEAPMVFLFHYEDTFGVANDVDWRARGDEYILAWEASPR